MDNITEEQLSNLAVLMRKLSPQQYDTLMQSAKPHVTKLEEEIKRVEYGELQVKMVVRAGVIETMQFFESREWRRQKDNK